MAGICFRRLCHRWWSVCKRRAATAYCSQFCGGRVSLGIGCSRECHRLGDLPIVGGRRGFEPSAQTGVRTKTIELGQGCQTGVILIGLPVSGSGSPIFP